MALRRSPTEILVRDSTSNETVPPSGQQMRQIADLTYSFQDYIEIMRTLWERIEDDGKNWRHVYKVHFCAPNACLLGNAARDLGSGASDFIFRLLLFV